jgi:hypothetical protein
MISRKSNSLKSYEWRNWHSYILIYIYIYIYETCDLPAGSAVPEPTAPLSQSF